MKMIMVEVPGVNIVKTFVCESCMKGEHISYNQDHRTGVIGRRDCKNVSDDGKVQCCCTEDWVELYKIVEERGQYN